MGLRRSTKETEGKEDNFYTFKRLFEFAPAEQTSGLISGRSTMVSYPGVGGDAWR